MANLTNNVSCELFKNHEHLAKEYFGEDKLTKLKENFNFFNTCKKMPLKNIKNIIGPCSYGEYELGDRKFYIFGENHVLHKPCNIDNKNTITSVGLFHSVFTENSTVNYDFFPEFDLKKLQIINFYGKLLEGNEIKPEIKKGLLLQKRTLKNIESQNKILNFMQFNFNECLDIIKNCDKYPKIRVQLPDIRELKDFHDVSNSFLEIFNKSIKKFFQLSIESVKNLLTNKIFKKHIDNIDDEICKKIIRFIDEKFIKYEENFNNLMKTFYEDYTKTGNFNLERFREILIIGELATRLFMDKYTLLRMFRNFGKEKKTEGGRNIYRGPTQNIIFYGGNSHAQNFCDFLENNGGIKKKRIMCELDDNGKPKSNCLNLDISTTGLYINTEEQNTRPSRRQSTNKKSSTSNKKSSTSNKRSSTSNKRSSTSNKRSSTSNKRL